MLSSSSSDQADGLRRLMGQSNARYVSLMSSVNPEQSNAVLINIAKAVVEKGSDVLLIDAKQSGSSIADHLGFKNDQWLIDIENRTVALDCIDVIQKGIQICRLSKSPIQNYLGNQQKLAEISEAFKAIQTTTDFCLLDLCVDRDNPLLLPIINQTMLVIVATANFDSLKQSYYQITKFFTQLGKRQYHLLALDTSLQQARQMQNNLNQAATPYMSAPLKLLGLIPPDRTLQKAHQLGQTVLDMFPSSRSAFALRDTANVLLSNSVGMQNVIGPNLYNSSSNLPGDIRNV